MKPAHVRTLEDIRARCTNDVFGCWVWNDKDALNDHGRPTVIHPRTKQLADVHRVAHELSRGALALNLDGKTLDHHCRQILCSNPEHLEAVTREVNERRKQLKFRLRSITRCMRGHAYDDRTRLMTSSGGFVCRQCLSDDRRAEALA